MSESIECFVSSLHIEQESLDSAATLIHHDTFTRVSLGGGSYYLKTREVLRYICLYRVVAVVVAPRELLSAINQLKT